MGNGSFNHCNLPPWVIASRHFNENPQPLELQGVREANRFFFNKLGGIATQEERALVFNDYMSVKFQLHQWQDQTESARKSLKNSYLRFLRGWMMDSNSIEAAVLKRWVESRMGIVPTYHGQRISDIHGEAYFDFSVAVMKGSARTNAIQSQLDLLYAYCQYELEIKFSGATVVTLYRGTYDAAEHDVIEQTGKREHIVRLNNLVSFTSDEERAWEFGTTVWKASIPVCKIFFYNDLLPNSIMKGEGEYIVIGGDFRLTSIPCTI